MKKEKAPKEPKAPKESKVKKEPKAKKEKDGFKQSKLSFSKKVSQICTQFQRVYFTCSIYVEKWTMQTIILQKKGSDSESGDDDMFDDSSLTSPPKREGSSRRAATKVTFEGTNSYYQWDEWEMNKKPCKLTQLNH